MWIEVVKGFSKVTFYLMFKIYFIETFKIFLVTYCHREKAGYYRMRLQNILFTFDMNHLMAATPRRLKFTNQ
ncbi:hypothetical protein CA265_13835 [Sphingobacteriaceae bacterium GW460-11-11-14-LB5]|nr:hypothetical protein CA265_13835 [Sphingobacteriaceae bacterium GW460-11-11-14-LB5]